MLAEIARADDDAATRMAASILATLWQPAREDADSLRAELLASIIEHVVLHGDLHHFNVLSSNHAGWLAIDPKRAHRRPLFRSLPILSQPERMPLQMIRRRLDILCEALALDRPRQAERCLVHAVLDACCAFEEREPFQARVEYAEQTLRY
jgi:streptomycin 6-kinase